MHTRLRQWIINVLATHPDVISLAFSQRAKFEGWLKFELAAQAVMAGATDIVLEAPGEHDSQRRADLSFNYDGTNYHVELKTPNANWRMPGVLNRTRPITKNIDGIVVDANKLAAYAPHGLIAFVLFPVPTNDDRWQEYINRIGGSLNRELNEDTYQTLDVQVDPLNRAKAVVCCFSVQRAIANGVGAMG